MNKPNSSSPILVLQSIANFLATDSALNMNAANMHSIAKLVTQYAIEVLTVPQTLGDEEYIPVPRSMLVAACAAIDKKCDGAKTLTEQHRYATEDISVVAASAVTDMSDAYVGAREDLAIWKRRALKAEALNFFSNQRYIVEPSAAAQSDEYPPLECDYCGALTPDPWHSSGMLRGKMSKHIHSCDSCADAFAAQATPTESHVIAITVAYEQGVGKGQQAHHTGSEIANPCDNAWKRDFAWDLGYKEGKLQAAKKVKSHKLDSKRLDYLQKRGATVELLPGDVGWIFRISGQYMSTDIREAIDFARKGNLR